VMAGYSGFVWSVAWTGLNWPRLGASGKLLHEHGGETSGRIKYGKFLD
jgi:hypothetical protein